MGEGRMIEDKNIREGGEQEVDYKSKQPTKVFSKTRQPQQTALTR